MAATSPHNVKASQKKPEPLPKPLPQRIFYSDKPGTRIAAKD